MLRIFICSCFWIVSIQGQEPPTRSNSLSFTISNAWNGPALQAQERIAITLVGDPDSLDVEVQVEAPYYDDPAPNVSPGENPRRFYEAEVVEVYFLNDDNEYLQVQLGPHGQYKTLFFNESREEIAFGLPLEYESNIEASTWSGTAVILGKYFPPKVTKFNAAAINGYVNQTEGNFAMLYPADQSSEQPNFHNLSLFEPISMSSLSPLFVNNPLSSCWETLLQGEFNFVIEKTWDLVNLTEEDQVKVVLKRVPERDGVVLRFESRFYDDPAPPAAPGSSLVGLWEYEVVEAYFLNADDQYLQIEIGPYGQYMASLFNGKHNFIEYSLQLNVTANINGSSWTAETFIPEGYFPPVVTKISAAAIHGPPDHRHYYTLTPTPVVFRRPDLHNLPFYRQFPIANLIDTTPHRRSPEWNTALENEFNFVIRMTWNGESIPQEEYVSVNLEPVDGSLDMRVRIDAPFYDDPPPQDAAPGESYDDLKSYEAVEVYFLNNANEYLQIQVAPRGQYFVIFYAGERHVVRHTMPLDVSTSIQGSRWTADVVVPGEYLPYKITKFNAAATHGPEENRKYTLLKPTFGPEATDPDYHNIANFKHIVIDNLSPVYNLAPISMLWKAALNGESLVMIDKTLDGRTIHRSERAAVSLQRIYDTNDTFVRIEAPFYNDTAPDAEPGPYQQIWRYEVVDLFFRNKDGLYLQIQVSPHGQYWVLLLNGTRNVIKNGLPLDLTTVIADHIWVSEGTIPADYFPPEVRLFNAATAHGQGANRHFLSANALPAGATQEKPDFHDLRLFQPFDMRDALHGPESDDSALSALWQEALESSSQSTKQEKPTSVVV